MANKKTVFRVPMFLEVGVRKKKRIYLNMNNIHTMHHNQYNTLKKRMTELVGDVARAFEYDMFELHYGIYLPDKLKRDVANVGSIIDKFVCDALSYHGWTIDDNYHYLQKVTYEYMGYDEEKLGYVEVTVTEKKSLKET